MKIRLHDKEHHNLYYIFEWDKQRHPIPFKKLRLVRFKLNQKIYEKKQK